MNPENKGNPLGYESINVLLRRFAIPSIAATLVISLYSLADQIFIGRGVGYLGNAATNVTFPFCTISMALAGLIGIGAAARFSISLGEGDEEHAARIAGNAVMLSFIASTLVSVIGEIFLSPFLVSFGATPKVLPLARVYAGILLIGNPFVITGITISNLIRADGSPRYSMMSVMTGAVLNIILDPLFIFVFGWGIFGAAAATVAGQLVSFGISVRYLWHFKTIKLTRSCFKFNIRDGMRTFYVGSPACVNQLAITAVQIVLNNALKFYGALSIYGRDIPLAACGIVMKTNAILMAFLIGIAQGMQPIIGYNYGARKYGRVKEAYLLAIKWNFAVSVIAFIMFQCFPQKIVALFGGGSPRYFEFAALFLRVFLFMVVISGVQVLSSVFFSSMGKSLKGLLLSLTRQVFFLIPLIIILPRYFEIYGVMYAGATADFCAVIVSVALVRWEFVKVLRSDKTPNML